MGVGTGCGSGVGTGWGIGSGTGCGVGSGVGSIAVNINNLILLVYNTLYFLVNGYTN
jgi:hypothetical protein